MVVGIDMRSTQQDHFSKNEMSFLNIPPICFRLCNLLLACHDRSSDLILICALYDVRISDPEFILWLEIPRFFIAVWPGFLAKSPDIDSIAAGIICPSTSPPGAVFFFFLANPYIDF